MSSNINSPSITLKKNIQQSGSNTNAFPSFVDMNKTNNESNSPNVATNGSMSPTNTLKDTVEKSILDFEVERKSFSEWRRNIALRGRKETIEGLQKDKGSTGPPFTAKVSSTQNNPPITTPNSVFCMHDALNRFVVGNVKNSRNNVCIVEPINPLSNSKKSNFLESFRIIHEFQRPFISDISWKGNTLICGTTKGIVYVYPGVLESRTEPIKFDHNQITVEDSLSNYEISNYSSRIHRVGISPNDPKLFLTLQNGNVYVWDLEKPQEPLDAKKVSNSPNFALDWNPHSPEKFIIGGSSQSIQIFDLRLYDTNRNPSVWKAEKAHSSTLRDIKWSPFIPHWIATAGEDARVKVWDIRFNNSHPVISLEDHLNTINRITWSLAHCDILVSGSSDCQCKIWNLRVKPHYLLGSIPHSTSVIGLGFSKSNPFHLYSCTSDGQYNSFQLEKPFFEPLIVSRFTKEDAAERQVEAHIFYRNFQEGFQLAYELAEKNKKTNPEKALALLDLCYERPNPDSEAPIHPLQEQQQKVFEDELAEYSYFIPPNFLDLGIKAQGTNREHIMALKINLELQSLTNDEKPEEILMKEQELYQVLKRNITSVPIQLLSKTFKLILSHNYLRALKLAIDIGALFDEVLWPIYSNIARMILYPTIYEKNLTETTETGKVKVLLTKLRSKEAVLEQLKFYLEFTELLWSPNPDDSEKLITFVSKNKLKDVIWSVNLNRIYANALLNKNRFLEFFLHNTSLKKATEGFQAQELVNKLRNEGITQFQSYLQTVQSIEIRRGEDIKSKLKRYGEGLKLIIGLLQNTIYIPSSLIPLLTPALSQLNYQVQNKFSELNSNDNSTSKEIAKQLIGELEEGLDLTKIPKECKKDVSDVLSMIKSNL